MSTHFNVYCETCEEKGPHIARSAGSTKLLAVEVGELTGGGLPSARFVGGEQAALHWARFLVDHEYHELTLKHE